MPTTTPWGPSQQAERVTRGITFYSTASHGGFKVSDKLNTNIHSALRKLNGWYEEDCEYAIVKMSFPQHFTAEEVAAAHKTVKNFFPHAYTEATGTAVALEESYVLRQEAFDAANKENLVVTSAWGDWAEGIPRGMVGVVATLGGKRSVNRTEPEHWFLVPLDEYNNRSEFGFVIDPVRHQPWPSPSPLADSSKTGATKQV